MEISNTDNHRYWLESDSTKAVAVRNKIQIWIDCGAARHYANDEAFMECPVVCAKAVKVMGYKWEQTV